MIVSICLLRRTVSRAPRENAAIDCSIENVFHCKKIRIWSADYCMLFYTFFYFFILHIFEFFWNEFLTNTLIIVCSGVDARVRSFLFLYKTIDEQDPRVPCTRQIHLTGHFFLFTQTPRASYWQYNIVYLMMYPSQLNYAKSYTTASHMTLMMMTVYTLFNISVYICIYIYKTNTATKWRQSYVIVVRACAFDWSQQISNKTDPSQQYTSTRRRDGWWTNRVYKAYTVTRYSNSCIASKSVVLLRHSVYKTVSYNTFMISCPHVCASTDEIYPPSFPSSNITIIMMIIK